MIGSKCRAEVRRALKIFCSQGRVEMRKRNFTSLAVKIERKWNQIERNRNSESLVVKVAQKCGSVLQSLVMVEVNVVQKCGSGTPVFCSSR